MKAIILAAGIGQRLAPLTDTTPKALIKLAETPLLEILLHKLLQAGFTEIAVNIHHHADQINLFLRNFNKNNKLKLHISFEKKLLNTGGGIKKILEYLGDQEPVLVHNVDIITSLDLFSFYKTHQESGVTATLAIQSRKTCRPLFFDSRFNLCGRLNPKTFDYNLVTKPTGQIKKYAFCGLQVIHPDIFIHYPAKVFYSIDVYLKNAAMGKFIRGLVLNDIYWKDLGTPEDLQTAENDIHNGLYSV